MESKRLGTPSVNQNVYGLESGSDLPLLTTKLYRPPVTANLEQRSRLIQRLERNRQRPLTLISAPAGYGKTMLASMWLESCGSPNAWVSLDEDDNDLDIFLRYFLAAIGRISPDIELTTQSLLNSPNAPRASVLAHYLLNDLNQIKVPFILVLDDTHHIQEPSIFALLTVMLNHPPSAMHLVLIGRHDPPLPITSLRAHSQVTEIRTQDLRFTPPETAGLMRQMLDRQIDDEIAAEWTQSTEGWVTALRLAALSLRHRELTDDLRVTFQGDSHYLRDYLMAEVLVYLPSTKQAWLLKTAILDRFCASLCEAVCRTETDPADLSGEKFINRLENENLFLVPLDDKYEWFRFHHLFKQHLQNLLQTQLSSGEIAALQRRAGRWCAEKGLLDEALQYLLAAGDADAAVQLVLRHRYELMNNEQWHRLERWLKRLPVDVVRQNPFLLITKADMSFHRGWDKEIISSLRRTEQLLANFTPETEEYKTLQSEIDVINALQSILEGQSTLSIDRLILSLKRLPTHAMQIHSQALAAIAGSLQMQGDLEKGIDIIRNDLAETAWPEGLQAKLMHFLCLIFFMEGELGEIIISARTCVGISEKIHAPMTLSWGRYHLGIAHYLRNEFGQAELFLQAFLKSWATIPSPNYLVHGCFVLALLYQAQDRVEDIEQVFQHLGDLLQETNNKLALAYFEAMQVEIALRQGKLSQARMLGKGMDFDILPPMWLFYVPQLTPIKLMLADGKPEDLHEADTRLEALDKAMGKINRNNVRINVLALQALVYDEMGEEATANAKLRGALELGIIGGNIRSFVDLGSPMKRSLQRLNERESEGEYAEYIEKVLAVFPKEISAEIEKTSAPSSLEYPPRNASLNEPLTLRERQVLKMLTTDLTLQEIALELHISYGTINSHTKKIYSKLDVHNRDEAVKRGKELMLI